LISDYDLNGLNLGLPRSSHGKPRIVALKKPIKRPMKTIKQGIVRAAILLLASAVHTFAIEGLNLSLQCSNVVLRWPSTNEETYIVQYRPTLDASTPWQTLTSSLPADAGTNLTFYVHSNIVQYPNCGGGDSFAAMSGGGTGDTSEETSVSKPIVPLAMRADGSSSAVPLVLYPPGYDLVLLPSECPFCGRV
jgi:hypothetical protein